MLTESPPCPICKKPLPSGAGWLKEATFVTFLGFVHKECISKMKSEFKQAKDNGR